MNSPLFFAAAFLLGLIGMEGVAWAMHRYLMHGPLWVLHKSHHAPRAGAFELNDLFGLVFAGLAIGLFALGARPGWGAAWWAAAGTTVYGVLYALLHDGLAHDRWPIKVPARGGYLTRLKQAHRLHHAVPTREGAVSFGFLFPADPRRLAQRLREQRS